MLGRDFVLETFRQYGVEYLFGNPGTTELPMMDGLVNYQDIEFIVSLHEDICVGMAAGYAQATGKPGVVNLHAAPGLAHGLGNVYDAFRASVPLIVTAGQQDSRLAAQEPALWGEMVSMVENYTKWSWEVKNAQELPVILHRAFKVATTEPKGPVFLSFPSDIMWEDVDATPIPLTNIATNIRGDLDAIQKATESIKKASKPIIVAGERVSSTHAVESLVKFSELTGARVYQEHQSASLNFPYTHPHFAGRFLPNGPFIEKALADADLVIFIGVTSQAPLLYFDKPIVQKETEVIAIDNSEWEIGKNMPVDNAIMGNPNEILKEMTTIIEQSATDADRQNFEKVKKNSLAKHEQREADKKNQLEEASKSDTLTAIEAIAELNNHLPDNAFIVDEAVTSGQYVHNYLDIERPNSLIGLKGGGLGYGMPASLGAQLGRPDQRVVNVIGDGSSLYYIQALWNAAKHRLPVVFVVINNISYMILKGGLINIDGESAKKNFFPGMDLTDPAVDFVSVAKGFGIDALRVETKEELVSAYKQAFSEKKPILLDIAVDPTVKVFLK